MKISLDTNIFGELDFVDWLVINKDKFDITISVIVALEAYHWYNTRNVTREEYELDLKSLGAIVDSLKFDEIFLISENAREGNLRFRHHARDYIIGTHAIQNDSTLITYNLKHFDWISEIRVVDPDTYVIENTAT